MCWTAPSGTSFPRQAGCEHGRRGTLSMRRSGPLAMVLAFVSVIAAIPLAAQSGGVVSGAAQAQREASGSAFLLQSLRPAPPPPALFDAHGGLRQDGWGGPRLGLMAGGSLVLPERMDFWSGAFVGGMVAYHDPFGRYRTDDGRVGRTILGALFGGLSGQPISRADLLRHGLRQAGGVWGGEFAEWFHYSRPPIERRAPPPGRR